MALAQEYGKLQARLRSAEAAVAHCAVLPPAVQLQLRLKAQIDEVESKVRDSEQKVLVAETLAKEAEENPLKEERAVGAVPAKAMPGSKGKGKGEVEQGPVERAKSAVEVALIDLKICMRYLEAPENGGFS